MRIGKQDQAHTAIATSDAESITIRGHDLCNDLIGQIDTADQRLGPVPYDGPVGDLLRGGNRHAWRAAHLHYIVRHEGMRSITTELFFENSEYIENDAVFGVRKSLIAKVVPLKKSDELEFKLARRPDARIAFDIVLAPEG